MAQMETAESGGGRKKHEKVRAKKMSTRVDLTAMVDLAFLLITFFMLTTTLSQPQTMEINMPLKPEDEENRPEVKQSKVLTLLLAADDRVFYYHGLPEDGMSVDYTNFSAKGVRAILLDKKAEVEAEHGKDETLVLIKASDESKYKNFVDILDEMSITGIQRYAIMDILPLEVEMIQSAVIEK
jgi:biopolymer transport protein ExbD